MRFAPAVLIASLFIATPVAIAQQAGDFATVNTTRLNLRAGPGTSHEVKRELPEGTLVHVRERSGKWARVVTSHGGFVDGWVAAGLIQATAAPAATAPRAPAAAPVRSYSNPLTITHVDFDCEESYFGEGGFEECSADVSVSISIPSAYAPFLADSVEVSCDGEVSYRTRDSYFDQSDRDSDSDYIHIHGGSGYGTIRLEFDLGFNLEPVVTAEMEDLSCEVY